MEKLLVIGSYPPKGETHHKTVVGGASYTKITLLSILSYLKSGKKNKPSIAVLAEKLPNQKDVYWEEGIFVNRTWRRKSLFTFFNLTRKVLMDYRSMDNVLIEFELAMFGGMIHLLILPFFVLLLRLFRKKVFFVCHQVINDINELHGHINIKHGGIVSKLLNFSLKCFYILTLKAVTKAIVFDKALEKRLTKFGSKEKICVIPLGVETFKNLPTRKEARKKLNFSDKDFVLLCFGFLAWYKGTDWIVNQFKNHPSTSLRAKIKNKNIKLVIAGGANPNRLDKDYYRKYVGDVKKTCKNNGVVFTGFVPEKMMPLYFQACDLTVFPYRTFMSTSAPLTLAFSFKKPFLASKNLSGIFETGDIKKSLISSGIKTDDFIFELNGSFIKKVHNIIKSKKLFKKMLSFSSEMKYKRQWKMIASYYYDEIFNRT